MNIEMSLETLEAAFGAGCAVSGCDHRGHDQLFFHATCHPEGEIEASFKGGTSYILLACRECKTEIVRIRIAGETIN